MALEGPPVQRYEAHILTVHFQFSGLLETVGPVDNFINDPTRDSLSLYDVRLASLRPGSPLKALSRPHVVVRKSHVVFLCFASPDVGAAVHTLAHRELLVAYTPVAVCRGHFHMPAESNIRDFLAVVPGELLPVTDARIFPLVEFPIPFPTETDLAMVGRAQLQFYHTP